MSTDSDVIFEDWLCDCPHDSSAHDDGFGCTEDGCACLAGWRFE